MLFKKYFTQSILLIGLTSTISGCGLLGSMNRPTAQSTVGATGCLDNSKDLLNRYSSGTMSTTEWKSAFDCIHQSLNFFTQYVHGSTPGSYSQNDMYSLISRFLITSHPVSPDLMRGAFNLKQSLFGGDAANFTTDQIALLETALNRLEGITSDLIPYLKVQQDPNVTYDELIEMITQFTVAGQQIGDYVATLPVNDMSSQALDVLITQLATTFGMNVMDGLNDKIFLAKWMMFNTRPDAIQTQDWPQFFRSGMTFAGIALAFKASENIQNPNGDPVMTRVMNDYHYREFIWNLVLQVKPSIEASLAAHGGNTPLPLFDHVIDQLPATVLNGLDPQIVKDALRPITRRLLMSQSQTGVDQRLVDTVFNLVGNIVQDLGSLDRLYEKADLNTLEVLPAQMQAAINQYASGLSGDDLARFTAVKNIILTYKPLFYKDTNSILYEDGHGYTRFQNVLVVAFDRIFNHLLQTYGSGNGYFVESDFTGILEDVSYQKILDALHWVDATVPNFGAKRFSDVNLFTPVSQGNNQATVPQVIHYAMMVISAGTLTNKMHEEITPNCDIGLPVDHMGWKNIPVQCFRDQFYGRLPYWLTYFPHVKAFWEANPDQQPAMARWLENGSNRNGYSIPSDEEQYKEVGKFDMGAAAAVLHYTEALFTRFDTDGNDILNKSEIMNNVYPVFKLKLMTVADNINNDYILKGALSYLVKYREMPVTPLTVASAAKFAWWEAIYALPTTKYSADRSSVFNIVCLLAAPERYKPADATVANTKYCGASI